MPPTHKKLFLSWRQLSSSKYRKSCRFNSFSASRQDINSRWLETAPDSSAQMWHQGIPRKLPSRDFFLHTSLPTTSWPSKPKIAFPPSVISLPICFTNLICSSLKILGKPHTQLLLLLIFHWSLAHVMCTPYVNKRSFLLFICPLLQVSQLRIMRCWGKNSFLSDTSNNPLRLFLN